MHVRKFCIALDNNDGYYSTGTRLTGRILLWLNKTKDIKGIKIKFSGKAHVSWQNTEFRNQLDERKRSKQVFYSGRERYINYEFFLVGGDHGKITINGGYEQVYPFYIDIPTGIPSSFQGKYGYIRYSITARLVKNWIFDTKEKIPVELFSPVDLNCYPCAAVPINKKEEKEFFTPFHSAQGPLRIDVSLPQTGFITEQDIPVTIQITNGSSIPVDSVEMKIMKVTQWKVQLPRYDTRKVKTEIARKILPAVRTNETKKFLEIFNCGHFYTPNLDSCTLINESFYLKVKVCVRSVYRKGLKTKLPIMFGTIPVCHHHQQYENLVSYPEYGSNYNLNSPEWNPVSSEQQYNFEPLEYSSADPPPYSVAISMPTLSPLYYSSPSLHTWTSSPSSAVQQRSSGTLFNYESSSTTDKSSLNINNVTGAVPTAPPQDDK